MACTPILQDLYGPEFMLKREMGALYKEYPVASRIGAGSFTTISGLIKPFLLPILAVIGCVVMPIIAAFKGYRGENNQAKAHLKAWGACVLTLVGTIAFLGITTYHMPLIWSSALVASICSLSIVLHVHKAMQSPKLIVN